MPPDVTLLLQEWSKDRNKEALDQLTPLVYEELRRLAGSYLRRERGGHTLQPTALIHEAYLRLVTQDLPEWRSRSHFFGVAAQLMRQILVDHARRHRASKRGGGDRKVPLEDVPALGGQRSSDMVALDDALRDLARLDERKARVVELRYFGGLSREEMAEVLNISPATVGRELRFAEAWLNQAMRARPAES